MARWMLRSAFRHPSRAAALSPSAMVLAAALTHAAGVHAQDDACHPRDGFSTCFSSDNLWLHLGGGPFLWQAPTQTVAGDTAAFGFATSYIHRPVGLRVSSADPEGTTIYAVENVVAATVLAGVGVTDRLQVGVAAPFVLFQRGASKADVIGSDDLLPRSAVGDVRLGARFAVFERDSDEGGPGIALRFDIAAPTGTDDAFASAPAATWAPGVSADYRWGRWGLGADVSGRIRDDVSFAGTAIGSQIGAGLGGTVEIREAYLGVSLEAHALFSLLRGVEEVFEPGDEEPEERPLPLLIPAEWTLSLYTLALLEDRFRASLGGGSFIPTGSSTAVTTPAFRFVLGVQYVQD